MRCHCPVVQSRCSLLTSQLPIHSMAPAFNAITDSMSAPGRAVMASGIQMPPVANRQPASSLAACASTRRAKLVGNPSLLKVCAWCSASAGSLASARRPSGRSAAATVSSRSHSAERVSLASTLSSGERCTWSAIQGCLDPSPPGCDCRSMSVTRQPSLTSRPATRTPARPAPTTAAWR